MNTMHALTVITPGISVYVKALETQKQEAKFFQFLNGLDVIYGPQFSQILMMFVLPSVEMACSIIRQEESQHDNLQLNCGQYKTDIAAMYSKEPSSVSVKISTCSECGKRGNYKEKCWSIIGYP